jgi:hypothetical protein
MKGKLSHEGKIATRRENFHMEGKLSDEEKLSHGGEIVTWRENCHMEEKLSQEGKVVTWR